MSMDDLDMAQELLDSPVKAFILEDGQSVSVAAFASAHIQLWYAKQHREYQRAMTERRRQEAEEMARQPLNPPILPYPGF
jgi:NADPH-dependent ferric siderophore reductase